VVRDDEGSGVPLSVWPGNEIEAELVLALICPSAADIDFDLSFLLKI
jgi:hypothetical protein